MTSNLDISISTNETFPPIIKLRCNLSFARKFLRGHHTSGYMPVIFGQRKAETTHFAAPFLNYIKKNNTHLELSLEASKRYGKKDFVYGKEFLFS